MSIITTYKPSYGGRFSDQKMAKFNDKNKLSVKMLDKIIWM